MVPRLRSVLRLLGFGLPSSLIVACGASSPPPPAINPITSLPSGQHLLIGAEISSSDRDYELLLLTPGEATLSPWQLQDGRGLTENGRSCRSADDRREWNAERRVLTISGCFGSRDGLNLISTDGQVTNFARSELRPDPAGGSFETVQTIIREGAIDFPPNVEYTRNFRYNDQRDAFIFRGIVYGSQPSEHQTSLYLIDANGQNEIKTYPFSSRDDLQILWSPDGRSISFVDDGRLFRLNLESNELLELSAELRANSNFEFTRDGSIIFGAQSIVEGSLPALYMVAPDVREAQLLVGFDAENWPVHFLLSPDATQIAFEGQRENPTTPQTIYVTDLTSGLTKDIVPPDLVIARTGNSEQAGPPNISLLTWSPDGQEIFFASSLAGYCDTNNAAGVTNCTQQLYSVATTGGAPRYFNDAHFTSISFALWIE